MRRLNLSRTAVSVSGLAPFLQTRPPLDVLGISAVNGVNENTLDLIRENFSGLEELYINQCSEIKSVELLLYFVYEMSLDTLQVFDIPVVDKDVVCALDRIGYDSLIVNSGLKD